MSEKKKLISFRGGGTLHTRDALGCLCALNKIFFKKKIFHFEKSCEDSVQIASLFVPESHDREKGQRDEDTQYHSSSGAPPLVQWLLSSSSSWIASKGGQLSRQHRAPSGREERRVGSTSAVPMWGLRSSKGPHSVLGSRFDSQGKGRDEILFFLTRLLPCFLRLLRRAACRRKKINFFLRGHTAH